MKMLNGTPASPGIALGEVLLYTPFKVAVQKTFFEPALEQEQLEKYRTALRIAQEELETMVQEYSRGGEENAAIFAVHKEMLVDEEVVNDIETMILVEHTVPACAVNEAYSRFIDLLSKTKDPLIAARTADLCDVRNRLLRILSGEREMLPTDLSEPVIIAAHELLPSDIAAFDQQPVIGIITEFGGNNSHAAILARSYKIPAVLGVQNAKGVLRDSPYIVLDALEGKIVIDPDVHTINSYKARLAEFVKNERDTSEYLTLPSLTASGEKIDIGLNVGSTEPNKGYQHCDFVGLFRTEFLYMENAHLPTEDQQVTAYKKLLANAMGKPVTLRTLDIGGDKPLNYLPFAKEVNPSLGKRGLRLCLSLPDIFRTQLRAALRASAFGELQIMFPMVSTLDELRNAKVHLEAVKTELRIKNVAFNVNIKVGIMIETPSIAMIADQVVREVDFASVGTNDLTQYLHAADRENASITDYFQSMSPSMLRILALVFGAFNRADKPISVCGELAGSSLGALALVGLGVHKLSMDAASFAQVKRILSRFTMTELQAIGQHIQHLSTQNEVIQTLKAEVEKCSPIG